MHAIERLKCSSGITSRSSISPHQQFTLEFVVKISDLRFLHAHKKTPPFSCIAFDSECTINIDRLTWGQSLIFKMSTEKSSSSKKQPGNSSAANSPSVDRKFTGEGESTRTRTDVVLPQSKVKVIMKSSPEIDNISADSVFAIAKATELFIDHFARTALATCKGSSNLEYKNLSEVVHKHDNLEFLRDIIPIKIPARVALAEMAKQKEMDDKLLFE